MSLIKRELNYEKLKCPPLHFLNGHRNRAVGAGDHGKSVKTTSGAWGTDALCDSELAY